MVLVFLYVLVLVFAWWLWRSSLRKLMYEYRCTFVDSDAQHHVLSGTESKYKCYSFQVTFNVPKGRHIRWTVGHPNLQHKFKVERRRNNHQNKDSTWDDITNNIFNLFFETTEAGELRNLTIYHDTSSFT
jgi:hypothetical protein